MNERLLLEDRLHMDYFSAAYLRFEEDFYRYSALSVPLTFLVDDILRTMKFSHKSYFKLNGSNALDGQDHYFLFKVRASAENPTVLFYDYQGHRYQLPQR